MAKPVAYPDLRSKAEAVERRWRGASPVPLNLSDMIYDALVEEREKLVKAEATIEKIDNVLKGVGL